jgi:hypothetical protein
MGPFMIDDNHSNVFLKVALAILKYRIQKEFGDEALQLLSNELIDIGGQQVQAKFESIFGSQEGSKQLLDAARRADDCFQKRSEDPDLQGAFSLSFGDLPTVQQAISELPANPDETGLTESLYQALARDFPNLRPEQIASGIEIYMGCLRQSLLPLKDYTLTVIGQATFRIERKIDALISEGRDDQAHAQELLRQIITTLNRRVGLLTSIEFTSRASRAAIVGHPGQLIGRQKELDQLRQVTSRDSGLVILHAPGGFGKTRLLIDFSSQYQEKPLWFLDTDASIVDATFEALKDDQKHIIILDDAHRFISIQTLRGLLLSSQFAGRIALVLVTRSVYVDGLRQVFSDLPADQIQEMELARLDRKEIISILEQQNLPTDNIPLVSQLTVAIDGIPLYAHVSAKLVQVGIAISKLVRSELLSHFLDELVREIGGPVHQRQAIEYLGIIALLGGINLADDELRGKIREALSLTPPEEGTLIEHLENARLIERHWKIIRVGSEVMADYIIGQRLLGERPVMVHDYRRRVIDSFLPLYAKPILTKLARLEIREESREIGTLLGQKLEELYRIVDTEGNVARFAILEWLDEVALVRANEVLRIIARIIDGDPLPDEAYVMKFWGNSNITHEMVLERTVTLLERVKYGAFRDATTYLHKIALYHVDDLSLTSLREHASKALIQLSGYELNKPLGAQQYLLSEIERWLDADFEQHFDLALKMLSPMLAFSFEHTYWLPDQPHTIAWRTYTLNPSDHLREIRSKVLDLLFKIYRGASSISMRQRVIIALEDVMPHFRSASEISDSIREWLFADYERVVGFFQEIMAGNDVEMPILDKISEWIWRVRRFSDFNSETEDAIRSKLKADVRYQLYRATIGWRHFGDEDGESHDWQHVEQKRRDIGISFVNQLSEENYVASLEFLEEIARQAAAIQELGTHGLDFILQQLGEQKIGFAKKIISDSIEQNLTLNKHLSFVVGGIKATAPDVARLYIHEWSVSSDEDLVLAAAQAFQLQNWSQATEDDSEQIRQLVRRNIRSVNLQIVWLTSFFAPYNQSLAIEVIKNIAAVADSVILGQISQKLSWPADGDKGWAIQFNNPQDFIEVMQNFIRLPHLDYHIEECLDRLGSIDPWAVLNFIEARMEEKHRHRKLMAEDNYDAVSFSMGRAFQHVRNHPEYMNILRRIRDWTIHTDPIMRWEAGHLLQEVAGTLDETMERVLMEWATSGDLTKMRGIAHMLHELNSGPSFYRISRELIARTDDEEISGALQAAIGTSPGVISGPFSAFHRQRIQEIEPWLRDDNFRVRAFAQRNIANQKEDMERDLANEAFEERNWPTDS